jgi:ribosomal protein S18 acetylase RimI-like enzyme
MGSKIRISEIHERNVGGAKLILDVSFPFPCQPSMYSTLLRQDISFRRLAFFNDIQVGVVGAIALDAEAAVAAVNGAIQMTDAASQAVENKDATTPPTVTTKLYVQVLAVLAAYRSYGVGSALMKDVIEAAKKHAHIDELFLHVWVLNVDAIRFYERLGFSKTETVKNYYRRIESPDAVVMRLKLEK